MKNLKKIGRLLAIITLIPFWGCSTSIESYKNNKPNLSLEKFFNGKLIAHGLFKDRFNKVKKTFVVTMDASWKDNTCTLNEDFVYNDGTKSKRIWTLKKISENNYEGTASDVEGAAFGKIAGNTLFWNYTLILPEENNHLHVKFEDWMYLVDEDTLLNHSYMSKFFINLGEVILSIRKVK